MVLFRKTFLPSPCLIKGEEKSSILYWKNLSVGYVLLEQKYNQTSSDIRIERKKNSRKILIGFLSSRKDKATNSLAALLWLRCEVNVSKVVKIWGRRCGFPLLMVPPIHSSCQWMRPECASLWHCRPRIIFDWSRAILQVMVGVRLFYRPTVAYLESRKWSF